MINSYFKDKAQFAYNYFENLFQFIFENKRTFPQGLIFEGNNTKFQLLFALELARILNCKEEKTDNCNCSNCKWIRSFQHPCVNLVSQIHSKPDDDTTSTVISVKQVNAIEKNLKLSSDYHRFFIFFSSKECDYNKNQLEYFSALGYLDDISFTIEPLNYLTFNIHSINSLLKCVEEPPANTTFVFLTNSKENIISTIVSRCQVFKVDCAELDSGYEEFTSLFETLYNVKLSNAFDISQKIQEILKDDSINSTELLDLFIEYLKDVILANQNLYSNIINRINIVQYAISMLKAKVSEKNVFDYICLAFASGYQK